MSGQLFARKSALIIAVLVLTACSGSGNGGKSGAGIDVTSTASGSRDAKVTSTVASQELIETPSGGIYIATPPSDEPIAKNTPPGPAPSFDAPQLPSTSRSFDSDGDGFYTFEEFQQAVAALYPTYRWPENYRVDPDHLLDGYAAFADQSRFEVGGEYTIIGISHQCAWERAWLDGFREGDEALMAVSRDQLQTVALENPMMVDESARDYFKNAFERAALGDPALIQQLVDNTCTSIEFLTATPGAPSA